MYRSDGEFIDEREFTRFVYWEDEMGSSSYYSEYGNVAPGSNGADCIGVSDPEQILEKVMEPISPSGRLTTFPEGVALLLPKGMDSTYNWQIIQQKVGEREVLLLADMGGQDGSYLFIRQLDQEWIEIYSETGTGLDPIFWNIATYPFLFQGKLMFGLTYSIPDTGFTWAVPLYFDGNQYRTSSTGWLYKAL
ncbi:MAG: hypothetical protein AAFQ98_14495 [Bacteroidota bacterium]